MGFVSQLRRWCAAALSAFVLFSPLVALAASTVSNAYDQPTSLVAGEQGNHHISITLNGAVSEGELINIAFDSGFDLSSIIEDDIDIADDAVDLTTAATCSGSEQVGVSISSQTITFDICAGDGGAMASGSVVDIEIGTNASASGTGASRIANPIITGTYYLNIGIGPVGSLVQSGSIPIPIVSEDAAAVSAIVSGGGGCVSDCGGGTTTEDTITVITPNGGEEYDVGDTVPVTWSSTGSGISFVDLYYSTDGGGSYALIVSGTQNDGAYTWTAPDVETTLAMIRAEGTDGVDIADTDDSDEVFTIHGTPVEEEVDEILVLLPAGGESYTSGDTVPITWTSVG